MVLITGATSGIGLELAKVFARNNHDLILIARRIGKLEQIKNQIEFEFGVKVRIFSKDLTNKAAPTEIFDELLKENIRVDVFVNNAGYGDYGAFADVDWEKQYNMVELNIQAMMHMTKLFITPMLQQK